jgi:ATP-dependent Lon protease
MFITTANSYNMPGPLLDRMEIISLAGYTEDEKREIARQHLLPKVMKNHGLKAGEFEIADEALNEMVRTYTREAGVRNLEREIAKVARKATTKLVKRELTNVVVTAENLDDYLGVKKFRYGLAEQEDQIGVVTGLAWTSVGGDILFIEVTAVRGKGKLSLTGQLGDVMKESAQAALTYARAHADEQGIPSDYFETHDIHIHVPAGAIPKDGPSAGITITSAIISVLTGKPIKRNVAMTGEVTLRGDVLPIGGVKEKVLAARAAKINTVILPKLNERDLVDVPEPIKRDMTFYFVEHVEDVLRIALLEPNAAEQKTTERAGRESKPLAEPEPAPEHNPTPVGQPG